MTNFKPLGDRVLIRRVESREVTSGGIIIPEAAKEKPTLGEVVAVGPGRTIDTTPFPTYDHLDQKTRLEMLVKPGDKVLFGKYSGADIVLDGEKYLIAREDEILGVVEGENHVTKRN